MTYQPQSLLAVRRLFQEKTRLPAVSLGIQHYRPEGGGYHEGNDLLAQGGRLNTDYSKRESSRDRPGSNAASAIDIGWFDVRTANGRQVTLIDLNRWVERNWNAPDAQWMREYIYSLDRKTVKRLDRMKRRTSGDKSHTTHAHASKFRDVHDDSNQPYSFFKRFWDEMEGSGEEIDVTKAELYDILGGLMVGVTREGYVNETTPPELLGVPGVSKQIVAQANFKSVNERLDRIEKAIGELQKSITTHSEESKNA